MDPITLVLRGDKLPAFPDPAGAVDLAEHDANLAALKTAAEQLDAEKLSVDAAAPVTLRATELLGTDDFMLLRGGVPYLVAPTVMASYFGTAPAATAPAAFTAGQWTATAGTTSVVINITALPSDGGSAITALQYRIGANAAVALTGTGTGSRTISGLTADVAIDLQVRAVNAVGDGAWSDTKTRTPAASVGGGGAAYVGQSVAFGVNAVTATAPAGLAPAHTQIAMCNGDTALITGMTPPTGWTLLEGAGNADSSVVVFTAPGDVAAYGFSVTGLRSVVVVAVAGSVRTQAMSARFWGNEPTLHTAPAVSAVAGDLVVSVGLQADGTLGTAGDPQAGYTRAFLTPGDTPPRLSVLTLASATDGTTGTINHAAGFADYSGRYFLTLAVQA